MSRRAGSMARPRRSVSIREASSPRRELDLSAYANGVPLDCSRPGKPTDNAYVEIFNATVRLEMPRQALVPGFGRRPRKVEEWRTEYNEVRPHSAIDYRTPMSLIHGVSTMLTSSTGRGGEPLR